MRDDCEISLVMPFSTPVPPSPDTSAVLLEAFAGRDIEFVPGRKVASLDAERALAILEDGTEVPYDLFSVSPCTARRTSSSRAGWPRTGTSRWTRERSRRAFRASTRSATSRRRACRKRASSRRVPRAWSRRRLSRGSGEERSRVRTTDAARATSSRLGPRGSRGRGLPLRTDADGNVPKAISGSPRRESALRSESSRALVRSLIRSGERTLADQMPTDRLIASADGVDELLHAPVEQP